MEKAKNKGFELDDDFVSLRSYHREKPNKEHKPKHDDIQSYMDEDIEKNKNKLNSDHLSINQIYNKNLDRLRYLNNVEDDVYISHRKKPYADIAESEEPNEKYIDLDNKSMKSHNYDDFLGKLNNMNKNYDNVSEY